MLIMQRSQTKLKGATRGRPCPLCERTDGCSIGHDGLVLCRRREGEQPGFVCLGPAKADSQWTAYRREGDPVLQDGDRRPRAKLSENGLNWRARAETLARNLTPTLAAELAGILGLPVAVLSEMPLLGFCCNGPFEAECWTFPEVDSAGRVIGLTCRHRDGSKRAWPGGHRGLTAPARWREREGPVYSPEGQSDTLCLTALGLAAIGRPSNMAGAESLAGLLRSVPRERPIIVLGEFDPKPIGDWPGRDGAVKVAGELAARLGRPVVWAMPPDGAKDTRAWCERRKLDPTCADAWQDAAEQFAGALKLREVRPGDVKPAPAFRWEPLDSAAFAAADYRPLWLAKKTLVEKQIAVIGGPQKALKTSVAIDLAISLAAARPWLGEFACPATKRVAVLSGESGPWALQSIARRVCAAKGIDLADLGENLHWLFALPQLAVAEQLEVLRQGLERDKVEVCITDPLYLCLLAGAEGLRAENLYETGPLLSCIARAVLAAGATPILLHHTRKGAGKEGDPLDLIDLAFSGIAEFARQWILLSRREPYDSDTGQHRLWLAAGGSVGHGGLWAVDVDEGQLAEDFTGRRWTVTVTTAKEARGRSAGDKEQAAARKREATAEADARQVLHALEVTDPDRHGVSFSRLRDASGLGGTRFGAAITRLKGSGEIEESPGTATVGNNAKRQARIIRKRVPEATLWEQPNNRPEQTSAADG
jgi:hypothetical protein